MFMIAPTKKVSLNCSTEFNLFPIKLSRNLFLFEMAKNFKIGNNYKVKYIKNQRRENDEVKTLLLRFSLVLKPK